MSYNMSAVNYLPFEHAILLYWVVIINAGTFRYQGAFSIQSPSFSESSVVCLVVQPTFRSSTFVTKVFDQTLNLDVVCKV